MVVMRFSGALGNQLFQYALYCKLINKNKEVAADLTLFTDGVEKREFYLPTLGIELREATLNERKRYAYGNSISQKMLSWGRIKAPYYKDFPVYTFQKRVFSYDDVYLDGYWQCPKYFQDIRSIILDNIKFPPLTGKNKRLQEEIVVNNSVSLHMRFGDYVVLSDMYGEICTKDYYRKGIKRIKEKVKNPVFYIFSDDITAAKKIISEENVVWVEGNSEQTAYNDMYLMSLCKHNIIANSSFSWWAAWLNKNKAKIVIAPKRWLNRIEQCDIWCDEWVRI